MSTPTVNSSPDAFTEDFNFSVEPRQFGPFSIGNDQFILKEASEAAHIAYKDATTKGIRVSGKDIESMSASVDGTSQADAILVQKCLFKVKQTNNPELPVQYLPSDLNYVLGLPRRITKRLYAKVRDLSGMDAEQETADFLRSRIAKDQERLAKLERDGAPGKDGLPSTTITSS